MTLTQALCDSAWILAGYVFAVHLTLPPTGGQTSFQYFLDRIGYLVVFVFVWCAAATDQRLFASRRSDSLQSQLLGVAKAVVLSLMFTGFLVVFFTQQRYHQAFLLHFGGWTLLFLFTFRVAVRVFLWNIRRHGYNFRQMLIVGANERARHLVDVLIEHGEYGYHIAGALDDDPERMRFYEGHDVPYLGKVADLERVMVNQVIDEVYVCLPVRSYYETIVSMAHLCEGVGTPIRMIADLFPLRIARSRVRQFEDIPFLMLSTAPEAQIRLIVKRFLDLGVSGLFLVTVAWWLFPAVALLIKLDSRGPVFFLQERVGLNQRRFRIVKFRSMIVDAEKLKAILEAGNEADGPVFKMRHDPRMTRVGRLLRKFSIDELPQLLNVFLGQMSLVGPRPPIPEEVEKYSWDQRRRLSVRPGITGLQQVSGRSDLDFDQWVELDLAYIDNWTLMQDFRILLRTFEVVVLARGAA